MTRIRLTPTPNRTYRGMFNYLVAYDYSAGSKDRYTVFVINVDDPVVIARELPLAAVRTLIADYEAEAKKMMPAWFGDREPVLRCQKRVIKKRKETKSPGR